MLTCTGDQEQSLLVSTLWTEYTFLWQRKSIHMTVIITVLHGFSFIILCPGVVMPSLALIWWDLDDKRLIFISINLGHISDSGPALNYSHTFTLYSLWPQLYLNSYCHNNNLSVTLPEKFSFCNLTIEAADQKTQFSFHFPLQESVLFFFWLRIITCHIEVTLSSGSKK